MWADQPWISALIHTSKTLHSFPSPVAPIDWVSVDDVATILESVILQPASNSRVCEVFNVVSEPQSWNVLVEAIRELQPAAVFEIVSLPEWVQKLRQVSIPSSADIPKLPALRLLDFYRGLGIGVESMSCTNERARVVSGLQLAPLEKAQLVLWSKTWNL